MREHRGLIAEWAVLPGEPLVDRGEIWWQLTRRDVANARHTSRSPGRQVLRVDLCHCRYQFDVRRKARLAAGCSCRARSCQSAPTASRGNRRALPRSLGFRWQVGGDKVAYALAIRDRLAQLRHRQLLEPQIAFEDL